MKRLKQLTQDYVTEMRAASCVRDVATQAPAIHCLIVEDDDTDAEMSLHAIGSVGDVTAILAKTGDDAMNLLMEAEQGFRPLFDIVFVDLKLHGSETQGGDVIKRIAKRFPKTHTIIVSGTVTADAINSLAGCYVGIVSKPLVADNMEEILGKHRMRK